MGGRRETAAVEVRVPRSLLLSLTRLSTPQLTSRFPSVQRLLSFSALTMPGTSGLGAQSNGGQSGVGELSSSNGLHEHDMNSVSAACAFAGVA
jgi:hypothetical protein